MEVESLPTVQSPSPKTASEMTSGDEIGTVRVTGGEAGVVFIEWEIPDFVTLAYSLNNHGNYYSSPEFFVCGGKWDFQIYPHGMTDCSIGHCVLLLTGYNVRGTLGVTAGIKGGEGVRNTRTVTQEISSRIYQCCWLQFCEIDDLSEKGMLNGDALIVLLEIKNGEPRDSSSRTVEVWKGADGPTEDKKSSEKQGGEKALEDFAKLLSSGEGSDVTLQVGDVEFRVHRIVLSARSPVLSATLRQNAEGSSVKVDFFEPDVFGQYLHYLYTGSVRALTTENAFGLYRIAIMYLEEDLKQACLDIIRRKLSVQTFCDAVRLAVTCGESDLVQLTLDFATRNLPLIIRSVEWQDFIAEYPREANEILIKCIGP